MKKVLLASTALVMSAGFASADGHAGVSLGGSAELWVENVGGADTMFMNDVELTFSASGESDGGMGFGFDYAFVDGAEDNNEVYISFGGLELRVGDTDDALQKVAGMGDIGFDGLGVDDAAEQARGDGSSDGVLVTYSAGDFSVFLSHNQDTSDDDVGVGVQAALGDFTIGLGYEDQNAANGDTVALDLAGSFGAASVALYYEDSDALGSGYGLELGYNVGDVTVNLAYADHDNVADAAMGIGFSYDLGGGATLKGGVADDGTDTNWDLGVAMSF